MAGCRRRCLDTVSIVNIRNFRYIALIEATSFLLLLVASYFKNFQDEALGVEILGPIHGLLFVAYVVMALMLREPMRWNAKTTLLILAGAVVPFGGYFVDRWLERNHSDEAPAT